MRGVITECHFESAETWFPGIRSFYLTLAHKPATFLELVWEYEKAIGRLSCQKVARSAQNGAGASTDPRR